MKKLLLFRADIMILAGAIKRMTAVALGVVLLAACRNSVGDGGATAPGGKDSSAGRAPGGSAGTSSGSAGAATTKDGAPVAMLSYITLKEYPHDTTAYTEGLLFHDKELYESTGHPSELPSTRSLFGVVDWATGKIKTRVELDKDRYFGEGMAYSGSPARKGGG